MRCALRRSLCLRPVLTEHRARVLNWALSHLFLFACLNCDLYLFVQVQEEVKESSVCETQLSFHLILNV